MLNFLKRTTLAQAIVKCGGVLLKIEVHGKNMLLGPRVDSVKSTAFCSSPYCKHQDNPRNNYKSLDPELQTISPKTPQNGLKPSSSVSLPPFSAVLHAAS